MILTRRGYVVLGVVVVGLANAVLYGPRALNAVVVPAAVALAAAVVLVRRIDRPEVERVVPGEGVVGERLPVELRLSAPEPFTGRIRDELPPGLAATANELTTVVEETAVAYDVTLRRRGLHQIGPAVVVARDVLGLAERRFVGDETAAVLALPRVRDVVGPAGHALELLPESELVADRGEFDSLREYRRGDPLRDVDWKGSARQPDGDFVVKEYADEADLGAVRIAAETVPEGDVEGEHAARSADAMAEATASVAAALLDAGLSVGVSVPEDRLDPGAATDQRRAILRLLARTGPGRIPDEEREAADVLLRADGAAVDVVVGGRTVPFERLLRAGTGGGGSPPAEPTAAAGVGG